MLLNRAAAEGGGLWNPAAGTMTISDVKFGSNTAAGDDADQGGGALFNDGGSLTVDGSRLKNNRATGTSGSGGGILNNGGDLTVSDTRIELGRSTRAGGGIEANIGATSLSDVMLKDNQTGAAPGNGGGLHLTGAGTVTISDGSVTGNKAAAEGGGLWNSATGMMTVTGTTISDNTAPTGPDTFNDGGLFTVDGTPVLPPTP